MKRTRLRRQSPKRAQWMRRYCDRLAMDDEKQSCARCLKMAHKGHLERHHPFGRLNERLLAYVYLCHPCHENIHDHGAMSREDGWLQPEFDGRSSANHHRPWNSKVELNWPENLKTQAHF